MPATYSDSRTPALPMMLVRADPETVGPTGPVALSKDVCLVGRDWGVHLPLKSKLVSKVHALVVRDRNGVYVRDLASRNRVLVNGEAVREAALGTGDVVRVGPFELTCASGFARRKAPPRGGGGAGDAAAAALEVEGGGGARERVPLDSRAVLIGSRPECEVSIDDADVAPVHAVVFELDGQRYVRDFNTSGGTRVNGESVHQRILKAGDEIRVGSARIRYTAEAADEIVETVASAAPVADDEGPIPIDVDRPIPVHGGASRRAVVDDVDDDLAGSAWASLAAGEGTLEEDDEGLTVGTGEASMRDEMANVRVGAREGDGADDGDAIPLAAAGELVGGLRAQHAALDEAGAGVANVEDAAPPTATSAVVATIPVNVGEDDGSGDLPVIRLSVEPPAAPHVSPTHTPVSVEAGAGRSVEVASSVARAVRELEGVVPVRRNADEGGGAGLRDDNGGDGERSPAVEKLDEIVAALSHDVAELETAWREVKDEGGAGA